MQEFMKSRTSYLTVEQIEIMSFRACFFNDFWCIKYVTLCPKDEVVVKGVTRKSEVQTPIEAYHTVKVFINE